MRPAAAGADEVIGRQQKAGNRRGGALDLPILRSLYWRDPDRAFLWALVTLRVINNLFAINFRDR